MDNEHYIDLMASQALQGLLASPLMLDLTWERIVEQSHNLAEMMFEAADALKAQARRIAELEEVHEANLKAIQINADVFADGMKKIMALCDAKDARIAELEAALKQSARVEASLASRIANLMDALEPFADVKVYPVLEDTTRVYDEPITYGDLRAARAAWGEKNDN